MTQRCLDVLDAPSTVPPDRAALVLRQTLVAYARRDRGSAQRMLRAGRLLLEHGEAARLVLWKSGGRSEDDQAVDALLARAGLVIDDRVTQMDWCVS